MAVISLVLNIEYEYLYTWVYKASEIEQKMRSIKFDLGSMSNGS